jgi:RNA polymerase sigma-70 factor (ECF subfamily)
LLQRIDLDGEDSGAVADDLHITRNNLTVRLHRARKQLAEELTKNCKACAKHGCLDCSCGEGGADRS